MKNYLIIFLIVFLYGCNKPKTVLICGDHECINKSEAEQYFEDNLTLEVKILDKKKKKDASLVQLNLELNSEDNKKISLFSKTETNKKIKKLSKQEIKEKKIELKKRNNIKKNSQLENIKKKSELKNKIIKNKTKSKKLNVEKRKVQNNVKDVCILLQKCNIDEISKFLVKQGIEKKYPDITKREN